MAQDNWKHRSAGMRCSTCVFFVPKDRLPHLPPLMRDLGNGQVEPVQELGRCRRHAPTMNGFPAVFSSDWCGDHKLDENKL